jgi:hypothetical protein
MSNKKETAVEWYSQQHLKLLIKLENKELSIGEYAVQHQEVLNQAKKMESNRLLMLMKEAINISLKFQVNNTTTKPMSNKKETAVSWLVQRLIDRQNQKDNPNFRHLFTLDQIFDQALQMESKKQQKYDEMLAMLEKVAPTLERYREVEQYKEVIQLLKEAKEL